VDLQALEDEISVARKQAGEKFKIEQAKREVEDMFKSQCS
jgi:hypothetical protein